MASTTQKIVFIMTDTQGANQVGCYGRPELKTPCLDKLASEGIRFDQAYTTQPVCSPARAGIFTGMYPHSNGVWGNALPLGSNIRTIGERLQDNGFHTAYMGKWHMAGTDYFDDGRCPPGWDPDYWYDMRCYLEEFSDEDRLRSRQELNTPEAMHKHGITEDDTYGHRVANRAVDFLGKHGEEPFFLSVSFDEPHGPSTCPPSRSGRRRRTSIAVGRRSNGRSSSAATASLTTRSAEWWTRSTSSRQTRSSSTHPTTETTWARMGS